ncbi:MAG: hypothetical protein LW710_07020 [Burkholderiales bacterium]|jgi:hypothetical protein|uniref:hypothetical protein n=1 Tax=Limnobacter sp. TaxID=2003368 RepID=UPI00392134B7|nr:hypothetical protein [Burkholderiales bacterium]
MSSTVNTVHITKPSLLLNIQKDFQQQLINRPDFKDRVMDLLAINPDECDQLLQEYPRFVCLFRIEWGYIRMPFNLAAVREVDLQFGCCSTWSKFTESTERKYPEPKLFEVSDIEPGKLDDLMSYQYTRKAYWATFGEPSPKPTWPNPLELFEEYFERLPTWARAIRFTFLIMFVALLVLFNSPLLQTLINKDFENLGFNHAFTLAFTMFIGWWMIESCPQCKKFCTYMSGHAIPADREEEGIRYLQCTHCGFAYWSRYTIGGGGGG